MDICETLPGPKNLTSKSLFSHKLQPRCKFDHLIGQFKLILLQPLDSLHTLPCHNASPAPWWSTVYLWYSGMVSEHSTVSGFECDFPLFRKRRYNVVLPSACAIGVRTSIVLCCLFQSTSRTRKKQKWKRDKKKIRLCFWWIIANGFSEWSCINLVLALGYFKIILSEGFLLFLYLFPPS